MALVVTNDTDDGLAIGVRWTPDDDNTGTNSAVFALSCDPVKKKIKTFRRQYQAQGKKMNDGGDDWPPSNRRLQCRQRSPKPARTVPRPVLSEPQICRGI